MAKLHSPTLLKRAYFSSWHLNSAITLLDKVEEIENSHEGRNKFDVDHTSYVITSIISSVAFLEASINEIYQDVVDDHNGSYTKNINKNTEIIMKGVWSIIERRGVLEKYQFALDASSLEEFKKGMSTYQNARLSILLRNELVHYKPESFGGGEEHDFANTLQGKFQINPLMSNKSNPFFPEQCLGWGCAEWVLKSCLGFADDFFERMNITPNYQLNKEDWYDLDRFRKK